MPVIKRYYAGTAGEQDSIRTISSPAFVHHLAYNVVARYYFPDYPSSFHEDNVVLFCSNKYAPDYRSRLITPNHHLVAKSLEKLKSEHKEVPQIFIQEAIRVCRPCVLSYHKFIQGDVRHRALLDMKVLGQLDV